MARGRFAKGNIPWNKKLGNIINCLVCRTVVITSPSINRKFCSRKCYWYSKKGTKLSIITRRKMSLHRGSKRYNFLGSKSGRNHRLRNSLQLRIWREKVFKRDNYTCKMCKKRGGVLNVDHILPWSLFPEKRFTLSNGRTLCLKCHKKTKSYLNPWIKKEDYEKRRNRK